MADDFPDKLVVSPLLSPASQLADGAAAVDVRLGQEFIVPDPCALGCIEPLSLDEGQLAGYLRSVYVPFHLDFVLHPRQLALGATLEYVKLPRNLCAHVVGRSRWARVGLVIAMATYVHPGYCGCLTLELQNLGDVPLSLRPAFSIAQMVFEECYPVQSVDKGQLTCATGPEFPQLLTDEEKDILSRIQRIAEGQPEAR